MAGGVKFQGREAAPCLPYLGKGSFICAFELSRLKSRPSVGLLPALTLLRMSLRVFLLSFLVFCCSAIAGDAGIAAFEAKHSGAVDNYFRDEVWAKVAAQNCLECHKAGGDAEDTKLVLQDPSRDSHPERLVSLRHNHAAFAQI